MEEHIESGASIGGVSEGVSVVVFEFIEECVSVGVCGSDVGDIR